MAYVEDPITLPTQNLSPKSRRCLRCQSEFDSVWAGDRICGKCKQTAAWRSGQPVQPLSNRNKGGRG